MLTFNVVAFDARGEPFSGLRAVDLDIRDDGKPMQAAFCRPLVTAERPSAPLGPREYTNRPTAGRSQSTLILLDLLNTNLDERSFGWYETVSALQKAESSANLYVWRRLQNSHRVRAPQSGAVGSLTIPVATPSRNDHRARPTARQAAIEAGLPRGRAQ